MKYFLHDTNSFNDEKVHELYLNFGYEGLGLFYTILEKLAGQEKPIKTSVLKSQLGVGKKLDKVWRFMEETLMISSAGGDTFNEKLLNFSEKYQIKKQKNKERILQWRTNQSDINNVTRYEHVGNAPKVKLSKVNEVNYLRLREKIIDGKLSDFFKTNFQGYLNDFQITHKDVPVELVLSKMDKDYIAHAFTNENHLRNTFKSCYAKLAKEKHGHTPSMTVASNPKPFPKQA